MTDLDRRYSLEEKSDCFHFIDDVQSKLLSQDWNNGTSQRHKQCVHFLSHADRIIESRRPWLMAVGRPAISHGHPHSSWKSALPHVHTTLHALLSVLQTHMRFSLQMASKTRGKMIWRTTDGHGVAQTGTHDAHCCSLKCRFIISTQHIKNNLTHYR